MTKILKTARLCLASLLLLTALPLAAQKLQQAVNVKASGDPLTKVFKRVEALTPYKVLYISQDVKDVKVTGDYRSDDIGRLMTQILKGTGLYYVVDGNFITVTKTKPREGSQRNSYEGEADAYNVSGKVVDENGVAMPGVSVFIVGTHMGTSTDVDGRYSVKVLPTDVLRFTFIGYKESIASVKGQKNINVSLRPDAQNLKEVQVVAFGEQKKESVVGAITTVRPMDLKTSNSDFTAGFAGKIAGVIGWQTGGMPGALTEGEMNTKFYIRGITSFQTNANTDPLILLDGVETSKLDLSRLQPEDIESFSVMKDASATAMYGARGANGVILVTTKKGEEGSVYTATRYECIVSSPTQNIDVVDPISYMNFYNQAIFGRTASNTPKYSVERIQRTASGKYPDWVYPANDWYDILFKNQSINHHAGVNIRGGSEKVQYYASVNFNHDEGIIKTDRLNDFSANIINNEIQYRVNLNIDLNAGIKLVLNSSATLDKNHGPIESASEAYSYAFNASPVEFAPTYPGDDNYSWPHLRFGTTAAGPLTNINPYALIQRGYKDATRYNTINRAEYIQNLSKLLKGLELRLIASHVQTGLYQTPFTTVPYYYSLANYDFQTGKHILQPYSKNITEARRTLEVDTDNQKHEAETRVTYEGRIYHTAAWDDHQTAFTGVAQWYERNFVPQENDVLEAMPQRNVTFSGRFSYGYKDRYFTEISVAYNGSERFAKSHRMGFFPSVGAGWVISSEPWMQKLSKYYLPFLKMRFSWGKVGNDGVILKPRYVYLPSISDIYSYQESAPHLTVDSRADLRPTVPASFYRNLIVAYPNNEILWEIAEDYNLGLETKLFGGLIELQADFYRSYRHNILSQRVNIPAALGIEITPLDNVGKTYSRGIDLSAKLQHQFSEDLWLILNGTLTYNKVTYKEIEEATGKPSWQRKAGREISQAMGYIAEGLFKGQAEIDNSPHQDGDVQPGDIKYRDLNGDGVIDVNDATFIGYPETPRLIYGFSAFVNWKNFEFSCSFQGSGKRTFFIDPMKVSPFYNDHAMLQAIADSHWSEDNQVDHPFWPRLSPYSISYHNPYEDWYNQDNAETRKSTYFMNECRFLRCTQLGIAYNFPRKLINRWKMKNIKISLLANNPFCITNFKLWDVELGENGFKYPIQKTYSLALQVNF